MTHRKNVTAATVLMALALATVALSGCTSAPAGDGASGSSPTATAGPNQPDTAPTFVGVQGEVIEAKDIQNDPDLYGAVALTGCAATDTGWLATGTATNGGAASQKYKIVLNVTDGQARTITSVVVDATTEAGQVAEWEAPAAITAPADSTCVIAGVSAGE